MKIKIKIIKIKKRIITVFKPSLYIEGETFITVFKSSLYI